MAASNTAVAIWDGAIGRLKSMKGIATKPLLSPERGNGALKCWASAYVMHPANLPT